MFYRFMRYLIAKSDFFIKFYSDKQHDTTTVAYLEKMVLT